MDKNKISHMANQAAHKNIIRRRDKDMTRALSGRIQRDKPIFAPPTSIALGNRRE